MKTILAIACSAAAAVLVISGVVTGDAKTASYKGTAICKMCHKAIDKPVIDGYEKSAHAAAMQKADADKAIVADFTGNAPFGKDKIAFVLGRGRSQQAYMDAQMRVLPAKWDVRSKSWKTIEAADGWTQCVGCHVTNFDVEKKTYTEMGVGCEACHGPGSEHLAKANKETAPTVDKLSPQLQAMVCGRCHSAGKDTSGKYPFAPGFRPGDDLAKLFVDAKPSGPGMNQQYSEFIQSKHAAAGLTCTTCHDPHNTTGIHGQLRKPVNEQCMDCHKDTVKDMASHAPTAPEGATCATCHMPDDQHTFKEPLK